MLADQRVRKVAVVAGLVLVLVGVSRILPGGGRPESADGAAQTPAAVGDPAKQGVSGGYRQAAAAGSVVHVAGAVRRPGVYRLAPGGRVRDAVRRAGGASQAADLNMINLAARLTDGQQVVVPARQAAASSPGAVGASGQVSLGSATAEQLDGLDGVGPAIARKIVDWRTQHGGFGSVDDLDQVPGIGPKKLEALRAQLAP